MRHDQQMGHSQPMLGQPSLFNSQDQLHEAQQISEFMVSAPSDPQQMSTDAQSDPRLYYEQCPKHGGPTRNSESNEDLVGSLDARPADMVVKETSGREGN